MNHRLWNLTHKFRIKVTRITSYRESGDILPHFNLRCQMVEQENIGKLIFYIIGAGKKSQRLRVQFPAHRSGCL